MVAAGGNVYVFLKIAATIGSNLIEVGAAMRGESVESFLATRPVNQPRAGRRLGAGGRGLMGSIVGGIGVSHAPSWPAPTTRASVKTRPGATSSRATGRRRRGWRPRHRMRW